MGFLKIILGGYGHMGKWVRENIIFMRFCCCFKLSKKIEKLLNEQPTHAIAKCTLTGLVVGHMMYDLKFWLCLGPGPVHPHHVNMDFCISSPFAASL